MSDNPGMTPEERFAMHEQWLLDHDKAIAEMKDVLRQVADVQRQQSAVMLEIAQHVARLLDREDPGGAS
jgi:hypothetical protein